MRVGIKGHFYLIIALTTLQVREAKMKLEKQKAETIVKLQEVFYQRQRQVCNILETELKMEDNDFRLRQQ